MSSTISILKRIIAVLNMPAKMGDKIIRLQSIQAKLTNNATFPVAAWPTNITSLAQYGTDVTAFISAETAVKNKTGTAAARNAALIVVITDLHSILTMVQNKADVNLANAVNMIQNAGFGVKKAKALIKQQNDALNTEILGTVLLTADAGGHHEWQMSKDTTTIINLPATPTAKTHVQNLTPGDVWYFRNHKVNTKKATFNWSPWVKLLIGGGGRTIGGGNLPGHAGSLGLPTT